MSTPSLQPDRHSNVPLIAVTQRVGTVWRCLLATNPDATSPVVLETVELEGDTALNELLGINTAQGCCIPSFPARRLCAGQHHCQILSRTRCLRRFACKPKLNF